MFLRSELRADAMDFDEDAGVAGGVPQEGDAVQVVRILFHLQRLWLAYTPMGATVATFHL